MTIDELEIKITADSTEAQSNIDALSQTINKLKDSAGSIGSSGDKAKKSLSGLLTSCAKTVGKIAIMYMAFKRLARSISDCFTESNDYIENLNLFRVTMGSSTDAALKYANSVQQAMGIDVSEWMRYQGMFQNLATGFGIAGDKATVMSQNLTQLSYDLSSVFNVSVEKAYEKLQSGMSGQTKALKSWGISVDVASMKEYMLEKGINAQWNSLNNASKATLRYNYILEKTTSLQGDMARTIATPANSLRILNAQITQLKRALGGIVSVVATRLIPYVQVFVQLMTEAARKVSAFFGFNYDDYLANLDAVSASANATSDIADSLSDGADSAKEIKKQLMGFDSLNILGSDSSDSSVSASATAGLSDIGITPDSYDFLKNLDTSGLDRVKEKFVEIEGIVSGLSLALGAILICTGQLPLGIALIALGVVGLISAATINKKIMSDTVTEVLTYIGIAVSGAALAIGAILACTGQLPLGIALIAVGAAGMVAPIALNWNSLSDKTRNTLAVITAIIGTSLLAIGTVLCIMDVSMPVGVALMAAGAASLATAIIPNWNSMSDKTRQTLTNILAVISVFTLVLGVLLCLTGVAMPLGIGLIVVGAASLATEIALNWDAVKDMFKNMFSTLMSIISGALVALGVILCLTGGGIALGIGLIISGLKGVKKADDISTNPITRWIKNLMNGCISVVESAVNCIIKTLNKINLTVPDWIPLVGGKTFGFNMSSMSIPRLADGGIVNAGQMFIAREAGPEMVGNIGNKSAVANNGQIVESIYRGVYDAVRDAQNGNGGQTVEATVDGEVLFRTVVNRNNQKVKQYGFSPLKV